MSAGTPNAAETPMVAVSWGELLDKITILEIKQQRLTSPQAVGNVRNELAALSRSVADLHSAPAGLDALKHKLRVVNETLWEIEDEIRAKEAAKSFDGRFVELARAVYLNNDERSRIKREINTLLGSELIEEKQYTAYDAPPQ